VGLCLTFQNELHKVLAGNNIHSERCNPLELVPIVVGAALLIFGRKLFWLFVGGVGFLAGVAIGAKLFADQPVAVHTVIALAVGILGAVLAIVVKKVAVGVAGFLAGGLLLHHLVQTFSATSEHSPWIAFLIGGIIGAILINALFDWALIVLSSLVGSLLIVQELDVSEVAAALFAIILLVCGIIVQSRMKKGKPSPPSHPSE